MSDLVKSVMTAINTCEGHDDEYRRHAQHVYVEKAARAAIRAVLAHYAEPANVTDGMSRAVFKYVVENNGSDTYGEIADAMAAALKEMEP